LTVNISPTSAANLVRATVATNSETATMTNHAYTRIYRGSTGIGFTGDIYTSLGGELITPVTLVAYDQPATASSTTYSLKCASGNNTNNVTCNFSGQAVIVVEEIQG